LEPIAVLFQFLNRQGAECRDYCRQIIPIQVCGNQGFEGCAGIAHLFRPLGLPFGQPFLGGFATATGLIGCVAGKAQVFVCFSISVCMIPLPCRAIENPLFILCYD
jgi:hypothetical protein